MLKSVKLTDGEGLGTLQYSGYTCSISSSKRGNLACQAVQEGVSRSVAVASGTVVAKLLSWVISKVIPGWRLWSVGCLGGTSGSPLSNGREVGWVGPKHWIRIPQKFTFLLCFLRDCQLVALGFIVSEPVHFSLHLLATNLTEHELCFVGCHMSCKCCIILEICLTTMGTGTVLKTLWVLLIKHCTSCLMIPSSVMVSDVWTW